MEFVPIHRHLGLLFSESLSWTYFIDSVVNRLVLLKKLGLLKKLKFKIGRKNLSKLYITFIRPILEYASFVLDCCSKQDAEKLEKVQLTATSIVTGLPIFVNRKALYYETGWETLQK